MSRQRPAPAVPVAWAQPNVRNALTQGELAGGVAHTLLSTEIAAHTRVLACNSIPSPEATTPAGNVWSSFTHWSIDSTAPEAVMAPDSPGASAVGQPQPNLQPQSAGSYCIATTGIFPSRN